MRALWVLVSLCALENGRKWAFLGAEMAILESVFGEKNDSQMGK